MEGKDGRCVGLKKLTRRILKSVTYSGNDWACIGMPLHSPSGGRVGGCSTGCLGL